MSDQPRKPAGSPDGTGGEYDHKPGSGGNDLPPIPPRDNMITANGGDDNNGDNNNDGSQWVQPIRYRTRGETRELLSQAATVTFDNDHIVLTDHNGTVFYRERDDDRLDDYTLKRDPQTRVALRHRLREPFTGGVAERRATVKRLFNAASSRERRWMIDHGDLIRYLPAEKTAASLRRRTDREFAMSRLLHAHALDETVSAHIIYAGYPNDRQSAMTFINRTQFQRYDRDTVDDFGRERKAGQVVYVGNRRDPETGLWVNASNPAAPVVRNRQGEIVKQPIPLANQRGKNARSYLRTRFVANPMQANMASEREVNESTRYLRALRDDPNAQAAVLYRMAYGSVYSPPEVQRTLQTVDRKITPYFPDDKGMNEDEKDRRAGTARLRGQGNLVRQIFATKAGREAVSREAVDRFLQIEPVELEHRLANTRYGRPLRGRNGSVLTDRKTGEVKTKTWQRLTQWRNQLHNLYAV